MSSTAERIVKEILALPGDEREEIIATLCDLSRDEIPQDFIEALDDFDQGRFVPMETALNEVPPGP